MIMFQQYPVFDFVVDFFHAFSPNKSCLHFTSLNFSQHLSEEFTLTRNWYFGGIVKECAFRSHDFCH